MERWFVKSIKLWLCSSHVLVLWLDIVPAGRDIKPKIFPRWGGRGLFCLFPRLQNSNSPLWPRLWGGDLLWLVHKNKRQTMNSIYLTRFTILMYSCEVGISDNVHRYVIRIPFIDTTQIGCQLLNQPPQSAGHKVFYLKQKTHVFFSIN